MELGAFDHDAVQARLHHQQPHHTVLEVLLGDFDLDRPVAGLEIGLVKGFERELDGFER